MKQASKKLMDDFIRITRKYWKTGDTDFLGTRLNIAEKLSAEAFNGNTSHWDDFQNVVDLCARKYTFLPNSTNAEIYAVFAVFGIEVVDDTEAHDEQSA